MGRCAPRVLSQGGSLPGCCLNSCFQVISSRKEQGTALWGYQAVPSSILLDQRIQVKLDPVPNWTELTLAQKIMPRAKSEPTCTASEANTAGVHSSANSSLQMDRKPWVEILLLLLTFFSSGSMRSFPFLSKYMKRIQAAYLISFGYTDLFFLTFFLLHDTYHSLTHFSISFVMSLLYSVSFKFYIFSLLYPIHSFQDSLSFEILMFLLPES